jgi:hypothetical protein
MVPRIAAWLPRFPMFRAEHGHVLTAKSLGLGQFIEQVGTRKLRLKAPVDRSSCGG